ncbi:hypothetical protein H257_10226 [Aphanomyces astaci]|uniref:RRM domain-containing protein n=1 Tax=Aphanomyces astaci TaxID=112090 RepID=W4G8J4_APHAT|nr:hypothetical protein H257_10226 [Aphanomyces astaci]ETV75374.1 hypothetical protein H257_10226 [Aphanomyces astaci]|eukprot:XP_009835008.1 hypothetical protein H257_10226 [Aphanomyces astaci]
MSFVTKANHKRCLWVGGLDKTVTEDILRAAFVPFGPLKDVQIPMDFTGTNQQNKGFGFVEYDLEEDAKEALDNMDDSELYGKVLKVNIAKSQNNERTQGNRAVWDQNLDDEQPEDSSNQQPDVPANAAATKPPAA